MLLDVQLPAQGDTWPFTLPLLRHAELVDFAQPVTLLVGENGSGKSTLLEALAIAAGVPAAGLLDRPSDDPTLAHLRPLADALRLRWTERSERGLFLRAEDYFGYLRDQRARDAASHASAQRIADERPDVSPQELSRMQSPHLGPIAARKHRYAGDLEARSHGESLLAFFVARLRGPGLYLLDEPEAALDPIRQLALLELIASATKRGAQFVIATHSVILAAAPNAVIYELHTSGFTPTSWDELTNVRLTRSFLDAPSAFLRHLEANP